MIATTMTADNLLYWTRLVFGLALIGIFVMGLIVNWVLFILHLLRKPSGSMFPAWVFGLMGFSAMPYGGIFQRWWLPLVQDIGILLIPVALALGWYRRQDEEHIEQSTHGEQNER